MAAETVFEESLSLPRRRGGLLIGIGSCFILALILLLIGEVMGKVKISGSGVMFVYNHVLSYGFFAVPGIVLLIVGLVYLLRAGNILVTHDEVVYDLSRSLFGPHFWKEPVANYHGVLLEERHGGGAGEAGFGFVERRVKLSHSEPKKCILLAVSRDDDGALMRKLWREFAVTLGLPALRDDAENVSVIKEGPSSFVRDSKLVEADTCYEVDEGAVPDEVEVVNCRNAIDLQFSQGALSVLIATGMIIAGICLVVVGAVIHGGVGLIIVGSLIVALSVLLVLAFRFTATRLSISSSSIRTINVYPGGTTILKQLTTDHVEEVYVADRVYSGRGDGKFELHIDSRDGDVVLGRGLPRDTLEWMKECVLCVIAGDDEPE